MIPPLPPLLFEVVSTVSPEDMAIIAPTSQVMDSPWSSSNRSAVAAGWHSIWCRMIDQSGVYDKDYHR